MDRRIRLTACRGCGQMIFWKRTATGKMMPLDPEPVAAYTRGTYVLDGADGCLPANPLLDPGTAMYLNHWSTCEARDQFRREKR